ncbi:MAG: tetratricopeptide repeat protein, partial [Bacteroidales bacterium]
HYYAGIAYLQLGKFEDAIENLEKFKSKDPLLNPIAKAAIADAYLEMGDTEKAIKQYVKAADCENNEYVTPGILLRAGLLYEKEKNYKEALKMYERIQKDFTTSQEAREIDRYIGRVKELSGE